jgi:cobalt/nickel transport system permease protein
MRLPFDRFAYTNRLRYLPPTDKILFAIALFMISFFSHPPVHLLIIFWISFWIVYYAGIPLGVYVRLLILPAAFLLASLPALCIELAEAEQAFAIVDDAAVGFYITDWYLYVSKQGMIKGGIILLRSMASIISLYFLLLTVPLVQLLQAMRKIKLPPIIIELLLIMYRFVFLLLAMAEQLLIAQRSRGGHAGFIRSLQDAARIIVQLFARTWQRYRQLSLGLAARGFSGELRVMSAAQFTRSGKHVAEAIVGSVLLIGVEWWTRR